METKMIHDIIIGKDPGSYRARGFTIICEIYGMYLALLGSIGLLYLMRDLRVLPENGVIQLMLLISVIAPAGYRIFKSQSVSGFYLGGRRWRLYWASMIMLALYLLFSAYIHGPMG